MFPAPAMSAISVQEIKARTIAKALEPIKAREALKTFRCLIQRINKTMIYAVNTDLVQIRRQVLEWHLINPKSRIYSRYDQNSCVS
jgi:hypothetical protein